MFPAGGLCLQAFSVWGHSVAFVPSFKFASMMDNSEFPKNHGSKCFMPG